MRRTPRILVIGGGIGGLAAAIALERQHAEVTVCEQSPKLSEIGAGIGLAPNAVKALRALGLEDKIPEKSNVDLVGEYKPHPFKFGGHEKGVKPSDLAIK